jgi:hypothetical protein
MLATHAHGNSCGAKDLHWGWFFILRTQDICAHAMNDGCAKVPQPV